MYNMLKINLLLLLYIFVFGVQPVKAQEKVLKIEDAMNRALFPDRINQLAWRDAGSISYVENNHLVQKYISNNQVDTLVYLKDLSNRIVEAGLKELRSFPRYEWLDTENIMLETQRSLFQYNLLTGNLKKVNSYPEEADGVETAPVTNYIAYTKHNNLFVSVNGKEIQVSKDKNEGIVNGQTVHRSEFGIRDGIFWSPKGNLLAFYRKDETMVTDYPLVDIEPRIAEVKNTKYPMAGEISEEVTVGIYNIRTGRTKFLKTDPPKDTYFTNITWSPDEKQIYLAQLNRDQNHMKLQVFDAATGGFIKTLFEETHPKYVEPEHGPVFLPDDPGKFLWYSERDGWNHLYLYDTDGKLLKQVTQGNWEVTEIIGFDKDSEILYYMSTEKSPLERHLYSVSLKSGNKQMITVEPGTHRIIPATDMKVFIDQFSSVDVTSRYQIIHQSGKKMLELLDSKNNLAEYNMGKTEFLTITNEEGTDLYCRMIKPYNFDPAKKYPVLVYLYGGPHDQLVENTWLGGASIWLNYLSSKGYIIWTLDNRGSAHRGFEFENAIFRSCGGPEVDDQMAGIRYLKSLPYVDSARFGIDGWSYGGFMSLSVMLKNPGVFKVATAGGPVIDWKWYEVMYGERYMDTPQTNPEGYAKSSLLNYVKNLQGKVMLIHGTMDPTVVWQHSLAFIKKCAEEGKPVDYMVYPGHGHGVGGKDRIHLWMKLEQYYLENL